jgi:hypothetical protein
MPHHHVFGDSMELLVKGLGSLVKYMQEFNTKLTFVLIK